MNQIKEYSIINGFVLKEREFVKDINSNIHIFEHEKTGAKLMYIENDDDNKSFTIGFKTPPKNDTGVMHILEHSVLCGSKKFPTKEPFVELCKGSLNTFLNAMTFSDKTVYPVSSRNEKDFYNLMNVYLDAVFYPNIYENDKIFKQEGWHYHIENEQDNLDYKGVVYNEMRGYFSSPTTFLYSNIEKTLFPDTIYAYESGGVPSNIPDLTYEEFLETHSKYYHPSNSYIVLYGDLDIEKTLSFINDEYLSEFDKKEIDSNINKQEPIKERKEYILNYSVSDENQLDNQTFVSLNMAVGTLENNEDNLAINILLEMLINSEEAPLKQAIIDKELGDDVFLLIHNTEVLQPYISIVISGSSISQKNEIIKVIEDTLLNLVKNGLDKKLIEGCISVREFELRESIADSTERGLEYSLSALASWLHGINPIERFKFEDNLINIKKAINEPYFENIIEKYMINNNHSSIIVLEPQLNLNQKEDNLLKETLKIKKETLNKDELKNLIDDTMELLKYQSQEDSEEALKSIPMLSIEDIEKEVEDLRVDEYKIEDVNVLHYDAETRGIAYISTIFNTECIKEEDISYIGLLTDLLTRVGTVNKSYVELSNDIMMNAGSLSFNVKIQPDINNQLVYTPVIDGNLKVLNSKMNQSMEILVDIFNNTSFEDEKRIKELIKEKISEIEMSIVSGGDLLAVSRMQSYFSPQSRYTEQINGLEYYNFLKDLNENIETEIVNLKNKLYEIKDRIFNLNNLTITLIGSKDELDMLKIAVKDLKACLSNENVKYNKYQFKEEILNEGLLIPSDVQYVAQGYNYKDLGYKYHGSMEVLKNTLRYGYLWNKIRVQGGAYGARFNITEFGHVVLCSYRDPNIEKTLKAYKELSNFIGNMELNDRELRKAIIGTISSMQLPTSIYQEGKIALANHISGKTKESRQKQRDEVLNTNIEDLRRFSKLIKDVINKECLVVVGNQKINECRDIFKDIYSPLK